MWAHSPLDLEPREASGFPSDLSASPHCSGSLWMGSPGAMTSSGGPAEAAQREGRLLPPAPRLEEQPLTPTLRPAGSAKFTSCLT